MSHALDITPAAPADLPALLPLMAAFHAEENLPHTPAVIAAVEHLLQDPRRGTVLLLRRGNALAGYMVLTEMYSLERGGPCGLIDELYVAPPHRRQGLARRALQAARQHATAAGWRALLLEVDRANAVAQGLYISEGFISLPRDLMVATVA